MTSLYDEPASPALPPASFEFDLARTALVLTDPQIDFLSPDGVSWAFSVTASPLTARWSTSASCWRRPSRPGS